MTTLAQRLKLFAYKGLLYRVGLGIRLPNLIKQTVSMMVIGLGHVQMVDKTVLCYILHVVQRKQWNMLYNGFSLSVISNN